MANTIAAKDRVHDRKTTHLADLECNTARNVWCRHRDLFQFYEPEGGSTAFPRLLTSEAIDSFCERLVESSGVFLLPAQVYGHKQSEDEGRFRIGLGKQNFKAGLQALQEYLDSKTQKAEDT